MASMTCVKIAACPPAVTLSPSRCSTKVSLWVESSTPIVPRTPSINLSHRRKSFSRRNLVVRGSATASPTVQTTATASPTIQTSQSLQTREEKEVELIHQIHDAGDLLAEKIGESNIYLIGMMGCGKTTIGKTISDALGYYFFDSDTVVEQTSGTSVAEIFSQRGESAFRDLETQAISNLSSMSRLVVATGGGAIIRPENWNNMRNGIVVWIDVPLTDLATRVVKAGVHSRPLVDGGADVEDKHAAALTRLNGIYENRRHLYPQADVRLSLSDIALKYGLESVSQVKPDVICVELLRQVVDLVDERHANNEYCTLGSTWVPRDMPCHHLLIETGSDRQHSRTSQIFVSV